MNLGIKAKCSRGMLSCRDCRSNGQRWMSKIPHTSHPVACGWDTCKSGNWPRCRVGGGGGRREVLKDAHHPTNRPVNSMLMASCEMQVMPHLLGLGPRTKGIGAAAAQSQKLHPRASCCASVRRLALAQPTFTH